MRYTYLFVSLFITAVSSAPTSDVIVPERSVRSPELAQFGWANPVNWYHAGKKAVQGYHNGRKAVKVLNKAKHHFTPKHPCPNMPDILKTGSKLTGKYDYSEPGYTSVRDFVVPCECNCIPPNGWELLWEPTGAVLGNGKYYVRFSPSELELRCFCAKIEMSNNQLQIDTVNKENEDNKKQTLGTCNRKKSSSEEYKPERCYYDLCMIHDICLKRFGHDMCTLGIMFKHQEITKHVIEEHKMLDVFAKDDFTCTKTPSSSVSAHPGCKTTGGTANGARCLFPFTYKDRTYVACTDKDHTTPWCFTNERGSEWGECPSTGCESTTGGNAGGAACQFPMIYKGTSYDQCTTADNGGVKWCYTTTPGKWGNCLASCKDPKSA